MGARDGSEIQEGRAVVDGRQAIDAQRIREVEFRERMRGYHQEDVDDFLEQVARGVEELERQLAAAKEEIASVRARSAGPQPQSSAGPSDDVIQRTLIVAQRAADQLREEAERETRDLRAEAKRQAERILAEARTTSRLIEEERRKNLMEELSELETEIKRRQEQLATLLKRDKLVREKLVEELGGLLASLSTPGWELEAELPAAEATPVSSDAVGVEGVASDSGVVPVPQDPAPLASVRSTTNPSEALGSEPTRSRTPRREANRVDSAQAGPDDDEGGVGLDLQDAKDEPTEPRSVQDFVFGHSIDEASEGEPFLLWRHDPEG